MCASQWTHKPMTLIDSTPSKWNNHKNMQWSVLKRRNKKRIIPNEKNEARLSSFCFTWERHVHMEIPPTQKGRYIKWCRGNRVKDQQQLLYLSQLTERHPFLSAPHPPPDPRKRRLKIQHWRSPKILCFDQLGKEPECITAWNPSDQDMALVLKCCNKALQVTFSWLFIMVLQQSIALPILEGCSGISRTDMTRTNSVVKRMPER